MTKISISEAIRLSGISRSQFYAKYIKRGIISVNSEHDKKYIDTSELIRVFGDLKISDNITGYNHTTQDTEKQTEKDIIIKMLEQQIDELRHQQSNLLEDKTNKKRKKFLGIF